MRLTVTSGHLVAEVFVIIAGRRIEGTDSEDTAATHTVEHMTETLLPASDVDPVPQLTQTDTCLLHTDTSTRRNTYTQKLTLFAQIQFGTKHFE